MRISQIYLNTYYQHDNKQKKSHNLLLQSLPAFGSNTSKVPLLVGALLGCVLGSISNCIFLSDQKRLQQEHEENSKRIVYLQNQKAQQAEKAKQLQAQIAKELPKQEKITRDDCKKAMNVFQLAFDLPDTNPGKEALISDASKVTFYCAGFQDRTSNAKSFDLDTKAIAAYKKLLEDAKRLGIDLSKAAKKY